MPNLAATSGAASAVSPSVDGSSNLESNSAIVADPELEVEFLKRIIREEQPFPHSISYYIYTLQLQTMRQIIPPVCPRYLKFTH